MNYGLHIITFLKAFASDVVQAEGQKVHTVFNNKTIVAVRRLKVVLCHFQLEGFQQLKSQHLRLECNILRAQ
jgi:hypothetical protein